VDIKVKELRQLIKDHGIVGAGGAGFPTYRKIDSRAETIILNCAECEPLLTLDQQLLARYAREILSALWKLAEVLKATPIVAIKKCYVETLSAVEAVLSDYPGMTIVLLEDMYPAGDEVLLIHEAIGVVVPPGTFPIELGCIVLNVETVYNIYAAMELDQPVTRKWVTIAGEVERPATVRVRVGTSISEALKEAGVGEITTADPVFIVGGPMMGRAVSHSYEIKKTTNAVIVLPKDHILARQGRSNPVVDINRAASACCQCRTCTEMCPRYLMGYPIEPHKVMRALAARDASSDAFSGVMYCSLCGLCEKVACPQSLRPRALIKTFKALLAEGGIKAEKSDAQLPVAHERAYRRIDIDRLKRRLGLAKYDLGAPMRLGDIK